MVVGITLRPQTRRTRTLVLLDFVEERLFALGQELFDGELALRVLGIQLEQFRNDYGGHTTICVRELSASKE